jgi:multidrug/hemolysin transport system permease protein
MIIALVTIGGCLIYIAAVGWYLSALDVLMIVLDTFLLVMMGTALSSVINFFLSSQGQISAVGSMVSSCYGFISGAYMPISQFPEWLQKAIAFLPGTYGTSLLREHAMRGSLEAMSNEGVSEEAITALREMADCAIYFFDKKVEMWQSYLIIGGSVVILLGAYIALNYFKKPRGSSKKTK